MSYKLLDNIDNITPISYKENYDIDDSIQRIFPESEFNTQIQKVRDDGVPNNEYLQLYITDKHHQDCIKFTIKEDLIYVDGLSKCEFGSGTELLHKVEQFAREFRIFKIVLIDESKITTPCDKRVSLQILSILTTGKSWYNKLGYVCEGQDEIYEHNKSIIKMKFSNFVEIIRQFVKSNLIVPSMNYSKFNELIEIIKSIKILNFESTVQEVFIKIKSGLKPGQHCLADIEPHLVLLIRYIISSNILSIPNPYTTIYIKTLQQHDIGKGTKRKGTKKKRTKKQKRTKITKTNKFLRKKLKK